MAADLPAGSVAAMALLCRAPHPCPTLHDLRDLLACHVDLVMAEAVRNPFLKQAIEASKKKIDEA